MTPWNLSRPDWRERIRDGRSLLPDLPFNAAQQARANRAVAVFNELRLSDVPGGPKLADACGEWFRDIVRALFGAWDADLALRMIGEIFLLVPKKNSKTSYGALMMLTALLLNERPRAKFIQVGPTQDVAEIAFNQIAGAVGLSPMLRDRLWVQAHLKKITDRKTGAHVEVMSFEPSVLTGQKHNGALIDELHVIGSMRNAANAVGQLRGGMIAYPESFLAFITTQSEKPPAGVFRAELGKARRIRDGLAPGKMLPILYEFPEPIVTARARGEEAWRRDTRLWAMVTPNAGRSITVARLAEDFETARGSGEDEVLRWASQHLNVEIGLGLHSDFWAGAGEWESAADTSITLETLLDRCEAVAVGVDGGGLDDLYGLALVGRERGTRDWLVWARAWCHVKALDRRKSDAARLRDFEAAGELRVIDRMGEDIDDMVDIIVRVRDAGLLAGVGVDPIGVGALVDALAEAGISRDADGSDVIVGVSQGYKLMGAIKTVERKLSDGSLRHDGSGLLAWCVANARTEARGNAILVTKAAAGAGKIDPLMAAFDGVALMSTNPEPRTGRSVYEDRGLVVFG